MKPVDDTAHACERLADPGAIERALARAARDVPDLVLKGRVVEATGILVKATGVDARVGEVCRLVSRHGSERTAEVVGFSRQGVLLLPYDGLDGIGASTEVVASGREHCMLLSEALLGRIVDGFGRPIDGLPAPAPAVEAGCRASPPDPLKRRPIDRPMTTGVRVIDALLTVGEGQRIGVFAPAGAGKSTLLGMLARNAQADVNVIALVGERGREVGDFLSHALSEEARRRSVCVVATSDRSPMERARAVHVASTVAEFFRDRGQRVMLMVDSLTRFARAQRDIGLACGETPTRRAFTPSVFAELPRLLERAGQGERGSITAFYTVLMEDEDMSDPIAEEVRSILDGHIVLSRKLAGRGHYPAVDVMASVSRVMPQVSSREHQGHAGRVRQLLSKFADVEFLLQVGEYEQGGDALADEAVRKRAAVEDFLVQPAGENADWPGTLERLAWLAEA